MLLALERGWLRAAVLDVFATEPLPAASPLWAHPRVTVTPHVAAISQAGDVADSFARNAARFAAGEPLAHVVDLARGY